MASRNSSDTLNNDALPAHEATRATNWQHEESVADHFTKRTKERELFEQRRVRARHGTIVTFI
jgi:hypothetical protein